VSFSSWAIGLSVSESGHLILSNGERRLVIPLTTPSAPSRWARLREMQA